MTYHYLLLGCSCDGTLLLQIFLLLGTYGWIGMGVLLLWSFQVSYKFFYLLVPMVGWRWAFFYYEVFRWVTIFSTCWYLWLDGDGPCSTMKFSGELQIVLLVGAYGWMGMGILLLWSFQVSCKFFYLLVPMVGWGWALFYYEVFRWVANFSTCWCLCCFF
jgi:hypothetical protein